MSHNLLNFFRKKNKKILLIDKTLAEEIEQLSEELKTNSRDIILAAIEMLKISIGRKVTFSKPGSGVKIELDTFEKYLPKLKFEKEK